MKTRNPPELKWDEEVKDLGALPILESCEVEGLQRILAEMESVPRMSAEKPEATPEQKIAVRARLDAEFAVRMALYRRQLLQMKGSTTKAARKRNAAAPSHALNLLQILVPKRIADEEIGDALEVIHALRTNQASRWTPVLVWLKVITTWLWVVLHAVREIGRTTSEKRKTD